MWPRPQHGTGAAVGVDLTAMKRQAALMACILALFLTACDLPFELGSTAEPTVPTPTAAPAPPTAVPADPTAPPAVPTATVLPTVVATVVLFPTSTPAGTPAAAAPTAPTTAPTAAPTAPSTGETIYVGNTGGIGVYVRRTTQADSRVKAYPDNTPLAVIGPDVAADGVTWKHVRAPDGIVGYVPAQYTSAVPAPTATAAPAPPSAAATPVPTAAPAPAPPATPAPVPVATSVAVQYRDATVVSVLNGEVIEVALAGENVRVRLIGIEAAQCFGAEAGSRATELLAGQPVRLELDASQGERDAAGQLLAYAWLQNGSMYNALMIHEGYAREVATGAAYRYQVLFKDTEQRARGQQKGRWQPGVCSASTPAQG